MFDNLPIVEDLSYVPDGGLENLRRLAVLLRREMPENFAWDFNTLYEVNIIVHDGICGTVGCALGLAKQVWPGANIIDNPAAFGLTHDSYGSLFGIGLLTGTERWIYGKKRRADVTPIEVADAIDRLLLTGAL